MFTSSCSDFYRVSESYQLWEDYEKKIQSTAFVTPMDLIDVLKISDDKGWTKIYIETKGTKGWIPSERIVTK